MTTMIAEVYRAFVKAGVPEQDAMAAAEALACMDAGGRAASGTKAGTAENLATKKDIDEVRGHIHRLELNMAVLKWMVGATLTGVAAIIVKIFFVA